MTAFASIIGNAAAADNPWSPKAPHFPPRAKHVIFVFLTGGLSAIDSFDHKPMLDRYDGNRCRTKRRAPSSRPVISCGRRSSSRSAGKTGTKSARFSRISAAIIDEFCQVRSVVTDIPNHGPSVLMMNTGNSRFGCPSMGSWITYGLGTGNQNLPGFIVLAPNAAGDGGVSRWGSAFLPAVYQGTLVPTAETDPRKQIQHLTNAKTDAAGSGGSSIFSRRLNRLQAEELGEAPELEATIQSMEIAFRMQTEAPDVFDIRKESAATMEAYGTSEFGRGCLMARRLVERGVRMVQLYHGPWDHHADVMGHKISAAQVDQPIAVLVQDLRNRGLLKDTLVVVGHRVRAHSGNQPRRLPFGAQRSRP